jgi:hypothetical protein
LRVDTGKKGSTELFLRNKRGTIRERHNIAGIIGEKRRRRHKTAHELENYRTHVLTLSRGKN